MHRRSQYEANRGTRLGKILPNTVDFYFFIRLIILEDFIRLISYNGPCVRLGCSFFLATALECDETWQGSSLINYLFIGFSFITCDFCCNIINNVQIWHSNKN